MPVNASCKGLIAFSIRKMALLPTSLCVPNVSPPAMLLISRPGKQTQSILYIIIE